MHVVNSAIEPRGNKPIISVISPFLNEAEGIALFCKHIDSVAKNEGFEIELIFVDDGSTDSTAEIVRGYSFNNCRTVELISLTKNYGSYAAIRAGLKHASGDYATFFCVDLQEPDDLLDVAYKKIIEGYDVVSIEKENIDISNQSRFFSNSYSKLIQKIAVPEYPANGIGNMLFSRKVLEYLNDNVESHSSLQLQVLDAGFNNYTIPMHYKERAVGTTKWSLGKKIKLFVDSIVSFSYFPIRAVTIIGFIFAALGFLYLLVIVIQKLIDPASISLGYPTIIVLLLVGFGLTNVSLGVIAEYLWRTLDISRRRPLFIENSVHKIK